MHKYENYDIGLILIHSYFYLENMFPFFFTQGYTMGKKHKVPLLLQLQIDEVHCHQ